MDNSGTTSYQRFVVMREMSNLLFPEDESYWNLTAANAYLLNTSRHTAYTDTQRGFAVGLLLILARKPSCWINEMRILCKANSVRHPYTYREAKKIAEKWKRKGEVYVPEIR